MFEVSVEGLEALSKKFDELDEQIKALQTEVPDELTAWQREDMHRRYPNTEANTTGGLIEASTEIWPRSRLEVAGGPKRIRPHRPAPKVYRPKGIAGPGRPPPSTRPILRQPLYDKFHERMVNLVGKAMKWPST
jgi:hypothetical protein